MGPIHCSLRTPGHYESMDRLFNPLTWAATRSKLMPAIDLHRTIVRDLRTNKTPGGAPLSNPSPILIPSHATMSAGERDWCTVVTQRESAAVTPSMRPHSFERAAIEPSLGGALIVAPEHGARQG
jgi:hypothetical protein